MENKVINAYCATCKKGKWIAPHMKTTDAYCPRCLKVQTFKLIAKVKPPIFRRRPMWDDDFESGEQDHDFDLDEDEDRPLF